MRIVLPTLFLAAATIISMAGILVLLMHKLNLVRESRLAREALRSAQIIPVELDR
ncbi:MAG TPA: hypothetical protein VK525_12580 [Candidatus Saccharimonadales bacterium]|jgi:hypothetical protein|nr:hypothetical protein [Candidatus Saccharimonadales bacterium]